MYHHFNLRTVFSALNEPFVFSKGSGPLHVIRVSTTDKPNAGIFKLAEIKP